MLQLYGRGARQKKLARQVREISRKGKWTRSMLISNGQSGCAAWTNSRRWRVRPSGGLYGITYEGGVLPDHVAHILFAAAREV